MSEIDVQVKDLCRHIAELEEEIETWKELAQANSDVVQFLIERSPELAQFVDREEIDG
jgi:hypothetical protein